MYLCTNLTLFFFFLLLHIPIVFFFFFLNAPPPTEISPLPLPAPLPIGKNRRSECDRAIARTRSSREVIVVPIFDGIPLSSAMTSAIFSRGQAPRDCASQIPSRYIRSEEHTSELQSPCNLVCRLLLEKKK